MQLGVFNEGNQCAQTSEIKNDLFSLETEYIRFQGVIVGVAESTANNPHWSVINLVYKRLIKVTRKLIGTWTSRAMRWMAQRNDTAKQKFRRKY